MKEIEQLVEKFKRGFPEYKCYECYLQPYKVEIKREKPSFPKTVISKLMGKS